MPQWNTSSWGSSYWGPSSNWDFSNWGWSSDWDLSNWGSSMDIASNPWENIFEDVGIGDYNWDDLLFDRPCKPDNGGTYNDDVIEGTRQSDVLFGYYGNDSIYARQGDDDVYGGDGNDDLRGGRGDDNLYGGYGIDEIRGGRGEDFIDLGGEPTEIWLTAKSEDDNISLVDDYEEVDDPSEEQTAWGGSGDDTITGEIYTKDVIYGGKGDDEIYASNQIYEYDWLNSSDEFVEADYIDPEVDEYYGGKGDDFLSDGFFNNEIDPYPIALGASELYGGKGDDTFELRNFSTAYGGRGEDVYNFDINITGYSLDMDVDVVLPENVDFMAGIIDEFNANEDLIELEGAFEGGSVEVQGNYIFYTDGAQSAPDGSNNVYVIKTNGIIGEVTESNFILSEAPIDPPGPIDEDEEIFGTDDQDTLMGENGDDTLWGYSGEDELYGGNDLDEIYGGDSDDYLHLGSASDDYLSGDWAPEDYSTEPEAAYGGEGADTLEASLGAAWLYGGNGDDWLNSPMLAQSTAGLYFDELFGGDGDDTINVGNKVSVIEGGAGADLIYGGEDSDLIFLNDSYTAPEDNVIGDPDYVASGDGNDIIIDSDGNNYIDAGDGNDIINAGDYRPELFTTDGTIDFDGVFGGNGDDYFVIDGGGEFYGGDGEDHFEISASSAYWIDDVGESTQIEFGADLLDFNANEDKIVLTDIGDLPEGATESISYEGGYIYYTRTEEEMLPDEYMFYAPDMVGEVSLENILFARPEEIHNELEQNLDEDELDLFFA